MKLFTIGYERTGLQGLVATLEDAGVKMLIDVRELPNSRRAGFSKKTLASSLAEHDIAYVHLRALGTPKEGRIANRKHQWPLFWEIVETALATPAADEAFDDAAKLARRAPSCLLCLEADHTICHRLRVAQRMAERYGFDVEHLHVEVTSMV